jgi:hypothetical protein
MTRKDFVLIAETIRALRFPVAQETHRSIVATQFANALTRTNPRFKRGRFIDACLEDKTPVIKGKVMEGRAA